MASIDTLTFAESLEKGGLPADYAKAIAHGIREHVMQDLVTTKDMQAALDRQTIRLAVIVGAMLTAAVGVLTLLLRTAGH